MKKHQSLIRRLALCLALAGFLLPAVVPTASADAITSDETATVTTTVYVGTANGTLTSSNNNATYRDKWQSTNLPALTLECSGNQMENASDTIALYSTASSCTYNLKAADGWTIKSVSLELKNRYNTEIGTTVTINGGDANTITYNKQTFTVTGLSATTVPIVVTNGTAHSTEWSSANWVLISNCAVTLERSTTGRAMTVDMSNGTLNKGTAFSSLWKSTSSDPVYILKAGANNMQANGTAIDWYAGSAKTSSYLFSTSSEYAVAGYFLTFKNKAASTSTVTLTANDVSYTVSDSAQTVFVEDLDYPSASLTLAGDNHAVLFSDVKVFLKPRTMTGNATDLFVTDYTSAHPYRIPAIAKTHNGDLLALSDYRPCGADIGNGEVDIVARRSTDNGATWGDEFTIADGSSTCGYGDAAIVADRESSNVLLICVSGKITYGNSTSTNRMPLSRFTSSDNGKNWSSATDITSDIYDLFSSDSNETLNACFFGSGRICQSSVVKVGDYYRLYAALCAKPNGNRVVYSDDFGKTWKILGSVSEHPAPSGDEPKCEELPDGTVILSSRMGGGRYFNFFTYTDVENAEGSWGTVTASNSSNSGAYTNGNSTNGEILILPAVRNSDSKEVYVALQSVPFGSSRSNVGIHYKELSSLDDVKDPATFAANWDGHLQLSSTGSAYSTMIMQANDSIAFLFEESTYGYDFTIIYRALNLERITSGAYSYKSDVDRAKFVRSILKERVSTTETYDVGTALGMYTPATAVALTQASTKYADDALAVFDADNSAQGYANAIAKYNSAKDALTIEKNEPKEGQEYFIRNNRLSAYYLALKTTTTTTTTDDVTTTTTSYSYVKSNGTVCDTLKFQFVSAGDGKYYIYNTAKQVYMCNASGTSAQFTGTTDKSSAGLFTITSTTSGLSVITNTTPAVSGYGSPNINGGQEQAVAYTTGDAGSLWIITPYEESAVATARASLCTAIVTATGYDFGTKLGQYSNTSETFTTTLSNATAAASDYTKTADELTTLTTALTTALTSAVTLNKPTQGQFLRIRATAASQSSQPYMLSTTSTLGKYTSTCGTIAFGDYDEAATIYYYDGTHLLSYATGLYAAVVTGSNSGKFLSFNGITDGSTITFTDAQNGTKVGAYNISYYSGRYLYTNASGTSYFADATGSPTAEQNNYNLEEVEELPVTVSAAGYATLYAPVALTIPTGVTAYKGVVSTDENYLELTEVEGTLPANMPVVLEATQGTYYFTIGETPSTLETKTAGTTDNILAGKVATFEMTAGDLTLQKLKGEVGFYYYTGTNIAGFKSYIEAENAKNIQGLKFSDSTTAIDRVTTTPNAPTNAVYDLQGRRVTNPSRGFYIIGGKKVFRL